jgi:hypothetical protein
MFNSKDLRYKKQGQMFARKADQWRLCGQSALVFLTVTASVFCAVLL